MDIETAYFGGGCFWNAERVYHQQPGVRSTEVGWISFPNDPEKGRVEVVKVEFDTSETSYSDLVDIFWSTHNPSNPRNQDQKYVERSVLIYASDDQEAVARQKLSEKQEVEEIYSSPEPFGEYVVAPEKDQKHFLKNT